jgi:hypothetical protein
MGRKAFTEKKEFQGRNYYGFRQTIEIAHEILFSQ